MSNVIHIRCWSCGKQYDIIDDDFEDEDTEFECSCGTILDYRE